MSARKVRACQSAVLGLVVAASACGSSTVTGTSGDCCVDLLQALGSADIRPADRPADALQVVDTTIEGRPVRALSARVPTRATFSLRMPPRAVFATALSVDAGASHSADAGVVFRLGIADERVYEQLLDRTLSVREAGTWTPVEIDLSAYAGWQWSLFYRPSDITWHLALNTYPIGPGSENLRGLWAAPTIAPPQYERATSAAGLPASGDTGVRRVAR